MIFHYHLYLPLLCVRMCVCVCGVWSVCLCVCVNVWMDAQGSWDRHQILWSWSYKELLATKCGLLELNLIASEKHKVLLTSGTYLCLL